MGKYTRNCGSDTSGGGDIAVMEVTPPSEIDNSGLAKRRKVGNGDLQLSSSKSVRFTARDTEEDVNQSVDVKSCDQAPSCCSSNGSITANMNSTDPEVEIGTTVRRESSPTSELKEESTKMESKPAIPPEKMPPAGEIEEFFGNAEKDSQKRFKDKYNYDIVKDVPLKGRFEWEKVKP